MAGAYSAIVIGAGSTGAAIAHDLALRGLRVTVLERAGTASGSTGHNQAQLHSGARYAVNDPESARECIQENLILRKILPDQLELNDGLFLAVDEAGLEYSKIFLPACAESGIPTRVLSVERALQLEPLANPHSLAAIQIPDGVFDPYRLCLSFLASACENGASVKLFSQVTGLDLPNRRVTFKTRASGRTESLEADVIINAGGPWAAQVAGLAGLKLPLEQSAGAMLTIDRRVCNMVLNLLAPPGDGDIIVPQRSTSILGTTSWTVSQPADIPVPPEHIEQIYLVAERLVPSVRQARVRGVMAAARPLLSLPGAGGRAASRGFACFDAAAQGLPGFFSIVGGKTTTSRLMAEKLSDLVCAFLHYERPCQTRSTALLSHRRWVQ